MRSRILSVALAIGSVGLLGSCDLGQTVNEMFSVFSVSFSSAGTDEPTIGGPSWVTAAAQWALPNYLGGLSAKEVLGQYHLDLTFHVRADNTKNSQKAAFGQTVQPVLNLYLNSETSQPISSTMKPFSVEGGQVDSLDFPVSIPLTEIDGAILNKILSGDEIPYFLKGTLNFDLMEGLSIRGSGTSEVELATGGIPTRPTGDLDFSAMKGLLK